MRVALGVLIRLLLPVANKLSSSWNGLRGGGLLKLINKIRETKGLMTTLLAFAANTVSMSLSSVQGKYINNNVSSSVKDKQTLLLLPFVL